MKLSNREIIEIVALGVGFTLAFLMLSGIVTAVAINAF